MTREANIGTQEKAAELINAGDVDAAVDMMFFHTLIAAFPDVHLEPATLVADDEHVCLAYTLTGTHQGEFQGVAPTGNRIEVRGMQIGRFSDGQIVERWGATDELSLMSQIGAGPKPRGALGKLADKLSP